MAGMCAAKSEFNDGVDHPGFHGMCLGATEARQVRQLACFHAISMPPPIFLNIVAMHRKSRISSIGKGYYLEPAFGKSPQFRLADETNAKAVHNSAAVPQMLWAH